MSSRILSDIQAWYDQHPDVQGVEPDAYLTWHRLTRSPKMSADDRRSYEQEVAAIVEQEPDPEVVERFRELDIAGRIGGVVDGILEGKTGDIPRIDELLTEWRSTAADLADVAPSDLEPILQATVREGGLTWRLPDLNKSIGALHKGDFVMFGSRPESGKTSWACSEVTHMVRQLPEGKHACILNNEEADPKIVLRLYQTALEATLAELEADPDAAQWAYEDALQGHRIDVINVRGRNARWIANRLARGEYGLIVFNMLSKVHGFSKMEGPDRLQALGQWARELAYKHGVVIALQQADGTAEGEKWLGSEQLYGSRTSLQAETDVQIMMGKSNLPSDAARRYFSVVRNKLPGGAGTDPALKYGKFECGFDWRTGLFASLSF